MSNRKPYPSDVSDEEWAFVAPYLTLIREDAAQRTHGLREVFNALRWIVRAGASWRMLPHDLPPWEAVYQQTQRWLAAGVFEAIVHDLRALLRTAEGRDQQPTAAILDSRTLRSTPESGHRAGYDGAKRKRGSKVHAAVDTLGHLLALHVTPASEQDREQVEKLAGAVQEVTGENVELAYVDQGYSGEQPAADAQERGIRLEVVKHQEAKRGFVLLPRRWVGSRARFCVGEPLSEVGQGLRATAGDRSRAALCRLCVFVPPPGDLRHRSESITRSRAPRVVQTDTGALAPLPHHRLRRSEEKDPSTGVADLAADVVALLGRPHSRKTHLPNTSLGGCATRKLALDRPDRVDTSVLTRIRCCDGRLHAPKSLIALEVMLG